MSQSSQWPKPHSATADGPELKPEWIGRVRNEFGEKFKSSPILLAGVY